MIANALETVRALSGVPPPTIPLKATVPPVPALRVRGEPPLIVLEKLIFAPPAAPLVVSAVTAAAKLTGPVIPIDAPLVVRLPPKLIAVPV